MCSKKVTSSVAFFTVTKTPKTGRYLMKKGCAQRLRKRYENSENRAISDKKGVRVTASKTLRFLFFLDSTVLLLGCNILSKLCPLEGRNATKDG